MRVLVIGSGGREHALVWKIAQSSLVSRIYCAPGNPGIATLAECVDIVASDIDALTSFAKDHEVDLVVVGPEDPLARGIVDAMASAGLKAFGPTKGAAELEASKAFAKRIMVKNRIPTAAYAEFTNPRDAVRYIEQRGAPIVVKADGLAAGKGVTVARTVHEAVEAVRLMMTERVFADAGSKVVIEECLEGEEASILVFTDGVSILPMMPSQDHKPVLDNDEGPNTGGMGAYAPAPIVTREMMDEIRTRILEPCITGIAAEGRVYRGVLYAGLMITAQGPKVIEFNCRFGDPETQVVLPLLESDLVPLLLACCDGTLNRMGIGWRSGACVSVVMASGGYPGPFTKGFSIHGTAEAEGESGVTVFHAGTALRGNEVVTNGGRVLNVTATAPNIPAAIEKAYTAVGKIHFENAHYRTDIGQKAVRRLGAVL